MPGLRGPTFPLLGSRVTLHVTWAVVLPVLAGVVALSRLPAVSPGTDAAVDWTAGIAAAVLALVGALVHESGHIVAARLRREPYGPSMLYFFGGVDVSDRPLTGPADEAVVAVAGPIAGGLLALLLGGVAILVASVPGPAAGAAREALVVGAGFSLLISLANLLPGDPLDGGRIVHGLSWRITGDPLRARRATARIGRAVGLLLVGAGFIVALSGDVTTSLVLVLAGWFVRSGAVASERRAALRDSVADLHVRDAMDEDPPEVGSTLTLDTFAPAALEAGDRDAYVVWRDGEIVGVLGVRTIRRLRRDAWPRTRAADAMTALAELQALAPDDGLWAALEALQRTDRDALPVLRDGAFVGLLTRLSVTRKVRDRARVRGGTA
jgi:Zn-dependent protease/predicted transcriptional regulator